MDWDYWSLKAVFLLRSCSYHCGFVATILDFLHHLCQREHRQRWLLSRQLSLWLVRLERTMDPPQTTLCHRAALLIVHPRVRIIGAGAQHDAQDQGGTNYWRRTLCPPLGAFVRELIPNRSFDVSMLQSYNYFDQNLIYINRLRQNTSVFLALLLAYSWPHRLILDAQYYWFWSKATS